MRKTRGFTLIELILVLGLVTTLGALAAPQFTAVFDQSKDQADIAQMDMLMAAFQLEQAPFYESHERPYDLLNTRNIQTLTDDTGAIVGSEVIPQKAVETLQTFLDDVTDPNNSVYMEDALCITTGQSRWKSGSVFRALLVNDQTLKIVCQEDGNESSIHLLIPKTDTISYLYSEDEPEEGTWMVIGDDDRLRAEYVGAMLHLTSDEAKNLLVKTDKGKQYYQYRTKFIIEYQVQDKPQVEGGAFWKLFTHKQISGTQKIGLDPENLDAEDMEYRYRYVQGNKWKGDPYHYEELDDDVETLNVAMGHTMEAAVVEFRYEDDDDDLKVTDYAKYGLQVFHSKDIAGTPDPENNDAFKGWIQTGANHWFYYELLEGSGGDGSSSTSNGGAVDSFTYHTGMVFNYINKNNYDFLSFEKNQAGEMVLRSYKVRGGSTSSYQTEKLLQGFQFNQSYSINVRIEKGKAIVNLSDGVLEENAEFSIGSDFHPAIGYYLGEEVVLNGRDAISDYSQTQPLVTYGDGKNDGPRLVLLELPEFNSADEETPNPPEDKKPQAPSLERIGISTLTINPVEFRLSTTEKKDFVIVVKLPEGTSREYTAQAQTIRADCSGKLEAYVEVKGKKSDKVKIDVTNIISPFDEIEGSYTQGRWRTEFSLTNYENVRSAMQLYQSREHLRLILETKGEKYEVPGSNFYMWNSDLDLNDFAIYVESEFGEKLSPESTIAQPSPPEIEFQASSYFGHARVTLSTSSGDQILYRFLDEDQDPTSSWKTYTGSFEESFAYIEVKSENHAGAQSAARTEQNPYHNALVPSPTITPLGSGDVRVEAVQGTSIWYKEKKKWINAYNSESIFFLEEGETLEVYAKSQFGSKKSEIVTYTREVEQTHAPDPPAITKPYWNRDKIIVSAADYDVIWYRYEILKNKNKTKWSKWKTSYKEVTINKANVIRVEAYTEKNGEVSETTVWNN